MNFFRGYVILMLSLVLSSCANLSHKTKAPPARTIGLERILSGTSFLGRSVSAADLPAENYLAISPSMEAFAERVTESAETSFEKIKLLHEGLLKPVSQGGQGIKYSAYLTETPINTFEHKSANCLSYTLLYVAMADHLGLKAFVNEVDIPPSWDMRNDDSVFYLRHVNAVIHVPSRRRYGIGGSDDVVIDLEMNRYRSTYLQRTLAPNTIEAQFYSNRATEILVQGDMEKSFLYLRKALQADASQSYIWNNMANLFRRKALNTEAELLYLHGLAVNKHDLTIMNNLTSLYRDMGQDKKAEQYQKSAQKYRKANPFHQYALAQAAFESGDLGAASMHIDRVLKSKQQDARFYALASEIYAGLGDAKTAAAMHKKSLQLDAKKF